MKNFFDLSIISQVYADFYRRVGSEKSGSIFGAVTPLKVALSAGFNQPVLYITSDFQTAAKCFEMFENLYGERVCLIKPTQDNIMFTKVKSVETLQENSYKLGLIADQKIDVVVAPVCAVISYYAKKELIEKNTIKIDAKKEYDCSLLSKRLVSAGYERVDLVAQPGQYSLRGDILDVYPIGHTIAYRINFFDVQIESMNELDGQSMKIGREVSNLDIYPCVNVFLEQNENIELSEFLEKNKEKSFDDNTTKEDYTKILNQLIFRLENDCSGYDLDYLMPLVKNKSTLFDYMQDAVIVIDECKMVYDTCKNEVADLDLRVKDLQRSGAILCEKNHYVNFDEFINYINKNTCIVFQKLTNTNRFFDPKVILNLNCNPVSRYTHSHKDLAHDIKNYDFNGYRCILFARNAQDAINIKRELLDYDIDYPIIDKPMSLSNCNSCIIPAEVASGFVLPNEKFAIFGTYDFLPRKQQDNKLRASRAHVFSVPKVGDYVVHTYHGIGICEGVQKLSGNFGTKDYVVVRYRDNDKLYVPIDQMDMLDKFSGAETPKRLSKIGGQEFSKVKERVKASVKKLAYDLVALYAQRESKKGFAYSQDNSLQIEFENSFPYTETEDQLISISEIKKDMEQGKVMDRLLCGDVGFGKTEVALRAAFKAILNGKQVAIMAPTTILCEQHYNTAKARLNNFGVNIACINRFKTTKQINKILEDLQLGKIDLICGTHRLLSKDVTFKDLGLIILDEEQKFGVNDKEKIKVENPNVDVLTLSATPIPRTLHMSLSGIRDVSIISTPPSQRLPIATSVTEFSEDLIRDAITKEMNRGGQVFVLFNSVERIYSFADRIRKIVPEAKVIVGHGQMGGRELEDVIYKFYHAQADVLVCTTIIENGIDIENANTLIVCDSDHFGLSQLYQLRGRVGRGSRMAYAYFTYKGDKVLTEEAYKRLDAISEFTEFGSGFKLAMRDLEIRGSGNILGAEQHGHMEKVGYELYSKLLADAVNEAKNISVEEEKEVLVKIAIDAFISDSYMTRSEDRMVAYKTIAGIKNKEQKTKVENEFETTFGKIPQETANLIDIAYIKAKVKKIKAVSVVSTHNALEIIFENKDDIIGSEIIGDLIYKFRAQCTLDFTKEPKICFKRSQEAMENFNLLKEFVQEI